MLRRFADAGANERGLAALFGPLLLRTPPSFGVIRYFALHNIAVSMEDIIVHHENIVTGLQTKSVAGSRKKSTRPDRVIQVTASSGESVGRYTIRPATFGPELTSLPEIEAGIVACEPPEAQGTLVNREELRDRIVVVERGGCTFSHKV